MERLTFCGIDCNFCPRYIATKSGSEEKLKSVAGLWFKCGWRDKVVPANEMVCRGCLTMNWCRFGIRECAMERKMENCGKCRDYPCDKIHKAFENIDPYSKKAKKCVQQRNLNKCKMPFFSKKID